MSANPESNTNHAMRITPVTPGTRPELAAIEDTISFIESIVN